MLAITAAPVEHQLPDAESDQPILEHWIIQWNDQRIGDVQTKAYREASRGQIDSIVSLDDAPAEEMLNEFFGPANQLIKMALRDFRTNSLTLRLTNTMFVDYSGRLESFQSRVYVGEIGDLFKLAGSTTGTTLKIDVTTLGEFWPQSFPKKLLTREFELPSEAFVSDAFSPPTELVNLRVGQSWHYHTYRALSPNQPLQRVEANVESVVEIGWHGRQVTVFVVALRNVQNDLSVADEEIGKMWVNSDGTVLKQSLRFGNLEILFLRDESGSEANGKASVSPSHD